MQFLKKMVAQANNGPICNFTSKLRRTVEPGGLENKPISLLSKQNRAAKYLGISSRVSGWLVCNMQLFRSKKGAHDIAMQGGVDPELCLCDKSVERGIWLRERERDNSPNSQAAFLTEGNVGERCGEFMVLRGEVHGLPKVCAAQNGKAVHSIGRDMELKTGSVSHKRVGGELDSISITLNNLLQGNTRCSGSQFALRQSGRQQSLCRGYSLSPEEIGDNSNLDGGIEFVVKPDRTHRTPIRSHSRRGSLRPQRYNPVSNP